MHYPSNILGGGGGGCRGTGPDVFECYVEPGIEPSRELCNIWMGISVSFDHSAHAVYRLAGSTKTSLVGERHASNTVPQVISADPPSAGQLLFYRALCDLLCDVTLILQSYDTSVTPTVTYDITHKIISGSNNKVINDCTRTPVSVWKINRT